MMSGADPINVALVGLGKMGVSHLAIANASNRMNLVAVCDSFTLLGQMVEKHCGIAYVPDYAELIQRPGLQAVIIATPTRFHAEMIRQAIDRGLSVFCEKPLTLSAATSDALAEAARQKGVVCQAGYHNRFVGTFMEARRLLSLGAIGKVRHVHAESYGPVVLKPVGKTWRSDASEGGGCLYDYAAHPINLLNWYVGRPVQCVGADLTKQYSSEVEDAVYANLRFPDGVSGQVSVNWSDETMRKMSTRITIWGDGGKIVADRQELQVYVGATGRAPEGYNTGWTVRYITDLTPPIDYYLRGEEYTAQMEGFGEAAAAGEMACVNDFRSAAETDFTLELIRARAEGELPPAASLSQPAIAQKRRGLIARVLGR
jgi:scyllo-inositol 2-dehydrogenase (NADP+)